MTHDDETRALEGRLPSRAESASARQFEKFFASGLSGDGSEFRLSFVDEDGRARTVTTAPALAEAFLRLSRLVASGAGFTPIPIEARFTAPEAAGLLNVPESYFAKLVDEGAIRSFPAAEGEPRRVFATDLFKFKEKRDAMRDEFLDAMAKADSKAGLI